jgi:uncharacterized protein YqeY
MEDKITKLIEEKCKLMGECIEVIRERNTLRANNYRLNSVVNALKNKLRGIFFKRFL